MNTKKIWKKGFTFLEIVGVLVLVGILVLIASSDFNGGLKNANKSMIRTNIELVDTSVKVNILDSEDYLSMQDKIEIEDLEDSAKIYNSLGELVKSMPGGDYYKLDEEYLNNSNLEGYFIFNSHLKETFFVSLT